MSKSDNSKHQPNVLMMMSGSIACAKASSLISEWTRRGSEVRVVCTRSVGEFVGHSTLQGLGATQVLDDVFASGRAMEHITLGQWADVVIVAPATSNLINKLSAGIADDAVSTVWQAAYGLDKKMVVVPAMNTRMWRYPATRESVERLRGWGIHVLPVGSGDLACGERGEGRMLEPAGIIEHVDGLVAAARSGGQRILVTAGGTRERIDSVRYIGNRSSGRTAARLAERLSAAGHAVTWLGTADAVSPLAVAARVSYESFDDLEARLSELLAEHAFDAVVHAAAVSDFSVASVEPDGEARASLPEGKLSSGSGLVLRLKPNPKLLNRLREWSGNPSLKVVGFKLTDTGDPEAQVRAVGRQFEEAGVDAVVHNDLADIGEDAHRYRLYTGTGNPLSCANVDELADAIGTLLRG